MAVYFIDTSALVKYYHAVRLLSSYALTQSLRTLDALQLAVALELSRRDAVEHVVCADVAFCDVARQENLSVINPETAG